jgi:hypothetical protein
VVSLLIKKIQCEDCGKAEYGEDLYKYNGEILCRYCIVARLCETTTPCEFYGECNDTTKKTKIMELKTEKQIEVKDFANELIKDYDKYSSDDLFKVYSDNEEIDFWAEEYVQEIKKSKEYKDYCKFIDKQIEIKL